MKDRTKNILDCIIGWISVILIIVGLCTKTICVIITGLFIFLIGSILYGIKVIKDIKNESNIY